MHKPTKRDRMAPQMLTVDQLRDVAGGGEGKAQQSVDKYNQTAKGIIDTIGR